MCKEWGSAHSQVHASLGDRFEAPCASVPLSGLPHFIPPKASLLLPGKEVQKDSRHKSLPPGSLTRLSLPAPEQKCTAADSGWRFWKLRPSQSLHIPCDCVALNRDLRAKQWMPGPLTQDCLSLTGRCDRCCHSGPSESPGPVREE